MKFLYQPVKPFTINQHFADNNACVSTDGLNRVVSCDGRKPPIGYKSLYGSRGHLGMDLKARHGQEVYCALTGVIQHIDTNPQTGLDVRVVSKVAGRTYRHIYEHLLGYQGKVGDGVLTGQLVGWADNTGWSSGDHLHFEVQEKIGGQWVSIDPAPLMFSVFARDHLRSADGLKWMFELMALISDNLAYRLRQVGRVRN